MKSYDVLGYAYEASLHCEPCARKRFPATDDEFMNVEDSDGNPVQAMFAGDEWSADGEYCDDCGIELVESSEPEPDFSGEDNE